MPRSSYELLPSHSTSPDDSRIDLPPSEYYPDSPLSARRRKRRWSKERIAAVSMGVLALLLFVAVVAREHKNRAADVYTHIQTPSMGALESDGRLRVVKPEDYTLPASLSDVAAPITFIPYTFGYSMLKQTLAVYRRARWRNIVVIDNSWDRDAWKEEPLLRREFGVLKVVLTMTHMRFAQVMGTMDTLAMSTGQPYYMWSHSDVWVIPPDEDEEGMDGLQVVLDCTFDLFARKERGERIVNWEGTESRNDDGKDKIGILFWRYDWLSVVVVDAAMKAPWDPAMMQYGSDCDRYSRVNKAGYATLYAEDTCPGHQKRLGKLFNMPAPLSEQELSLVLANDTSFETRVATIQTANDELGPDAYAWREDQGKGRMHEVDKKMFESYRHGGMSYYEDKWGQGMGRECVLDGKDPSFDIPELPGRVAVVESQKGKEEERRR